MLHVEFGAFDEVAEVRLQKRKVGPRSFGLRHSRRLHQGGGSQRDGELLKQGQALCVVGHGRCAGAAFWGGELRGTGAQNTAHQVIEHFEFGFERQAGGQGTGLFAQLRQGFFTTGVAGVEQAFFDSFTPHRSAVGTACGLQVFKQQAGKRWKVKFAPEHGGVAGRRRWAFPEHNGQARQLGCALGVVRQVYHAIFGLTTVEGAAVAEHGTRKQSSQHPQALAGHKGRPV